MKKLGSLDIVSQFYDSLHTAILLALIDRYVHFILMLSRLILRKLGYLRMSIILSYYYWIATQKINTL